MNNNEKYSKYQKNNLPTPHYNKERNLIEYVYFKDQEVEVDDCLSDALGEICQTSLYYSFETKVYTTQMIDGKKVVTSETIHEHAHHFDEVVEALYDAPESFHISKKDEELYSAQQLDYLLHVKNYLLFIGMKDIIDGKRPVSRYRNKLYAKYKNARLYTFLKSDILALVQNHRTYRVVGLAKETTEDEIYNPEEHQALVIGKKGKVKAFIEFTSRKVVSYATIKADYPSKKYKDEDLVIVESYNILEIFN